MARKLRPSSGLITFLIRPLRVPELRHGLPTGAMFLCRSGARPGGSVSGQSLSITYRCELAR